MHNVTLDLSQKAVRFLVLSLDFRLEHWRKQLAGGALSDDEEADIRNDLAFLEGVREHLVNAIPKKPDEP